MPRSSLKIGAIVLAVLAGTAGLAPEAEAQRPFAVVDPFYQEETARLSFFDGFAAQAHVAYRGGEPMQVEGVTGSPMALSLRLDYALTRQVAVAAVVDASGGFDGSVSRSPVRLSWLIVQPHWHHNGTDYAVRLAVDPAGDGGFGFRQVDVAFLSSWDESPTLSTDMAIGLRRAQVGFERFEFPSVTPVGFPQFEETRPELVRSRASGTEVHFMWGHRFWLSPSGTHIFSTLSAEGMVYELITARNTQVAGRPGDASFDDGTESNLLGGVSRLNVGMEYTRPSFIVSPYASLPLFRFARYQRESQTWGPRVDHARFGLRVTVR